MQPDDVRRLALALPGATEEPHFDSASFRVRGRIFATLPADDEHAHVFVEAEEAVAVAAGEAACEELWWGRKLSGVRIRLAAAEPELVAELLQASWRRRAPKRVVADFDGR